MLKWLRGKKTIVTGVAMIGWGIWQYTIEGDPTTGTQRVMEGLGLIFLRTAIMKAS